MRNEYEANREMALLPLFRNAAGIDRFDAKIGVHFAKPAPKRETKAKPGFISRILSRKG